MKAPKLLKNESATSFKRRVKAWEQRTGQKYPRSRFGKSDEERILDGAITTTSRLDQKKDYSKDYDLDQVAKEEALSPGYYKEFLESKEGQEFSESEAAIQEGIETDRREDLLLQISQEGVTLPKAAEKRQKEAETTVGTQLGQAFTSDIDEEGNTRLAVFDRTVATERAKIMNANAAVKKVDAYTNHSYTTNFKEAFRNANKTQVYEDSMDPNTGLPLVKSNVFTIDPATGLPLGVMGRSQRRAWDEAMAKKNAPDFNTPEQDKLEYDPSDAYPNRIDDNIPEETIGTQLGEGLKNIGDASNPKISFEPAKKDEDD